MSATWVTEYDDAARRGSCSCGCWTVYGVTAHEFGRASARHLAWHAQRERRGAPLPLGAEVGFPARNDDDWIGRTMLQIQALPTADVER